MIALSLFSKNSWLSTYSRGFCYVIIIKKTKTHQTTKGVFF
jgi:hypothetical protein